MKLKLFSSGEPVEMENQEEYMEVNALGSREVRKFGIKIEKLDEFGDTDRILRAVRAGSIVFLKIKGLKEKDIGELKRAVEKLKKSVVANNGDIAGVEQEWLIITPEHATIERE